MSNAEPMEVRQAPRDPGKERAGLCLGKVRRDAARVGGGGVSAPLDVTEQVFPAELHDHIDGAVLAKGLDKRAHVFVPAELLHAAEDFDLERWVFFELPRFAVCGGCRRCRRRRHRARRGRLLALEQAHVHDLDRELLPARVAAPDDAAEERLAEEADGSVPVLEERGGGGRVGRHHALR